MNNQLFRQQAEYLGYELTEYDLEQIKEHYFWLIVNYQGSIRVCRRILNLYFSDRPCHNEGDRQ